MIREVSLVLAGANPEARIENINLAHSDEVLDDEAIIWSGTNIELVHGEQENSDASDESTEDSTELSHEEGDKDDEEKEDPKTVKDVYDSMTPEQQNVVHYMISEVLEADKADDGDDEDKDNDDTLKQDNVGDDETNLKGTEEMKHNVFENSGQADDKVLSHAQLKEIVANAAKSGSLRDAVDQYALAHGIDNIEIMFPDAQALDATPEWLKRRTEWVDQFMNATRKTPFSRVKTLIADITEEDARAKGYIKGNLKKEEFFSVSKRVTTPTTVYKKQKLDRDDIIDITDFDVVAWLKVEMRLMIDEEIARAALIGDGRDVASEDKINEQNIRPILTDHELYTVTVNVNVSDADSSAEEAVEAIIRHRSKYRGTG
jgi:hypothetical protein